MWFRKNYLGAGAAMRVERRDEVCRTCASASHHAGRPVNQRSRSQMAMGSVPKSCRAVWRTLIVLIKYRNSQDLGFSALLPWLFVCVGVFGTALLAIWIQHLDTGVACLAGSWELHVPWQCHMRMAVGCRGLFICILGSRFNKGTFGPCSGNGGSLTV